jgi:argininosuccinate synthase
MASLFLSSGENLMTNNNRVVLAYSGGLDTSVILKWLLNEGHAVVAYMADLGQQEDFAAAKAKALAIGAEEVVVDDLRETFVTDYIFPAFAGNAVYEGRYLLGTSLARPLIARGQIACARQHGAAFVSHGATGKGNDQVRFELSYYALMPEVRVLAPWKMPEFLGRFRGRTDMLHYAEQHGIPVTATQAKPYSEDENLLHISHEAGILEDPGAAAEEGVYSRTTDPSKAPDTPELLTIAFESGFPVALNGAQMAPLTLFRVLNEAGARHGVGRLDMVENRYVGIKSRGVYESPGGAILHAALRDLEGLTMDRAVLRVRDRLALDFADLIYNGFWFSPEMRVLRAALDAAAQTTTGEVDVRLYKGQVYPVARRSAVALYDPAKSSMDEEGGFNQQDSEGFIRVTAQRLIASARRAPLG